MRPPFRQNFVDEENAEEPEEQVNCLDEDDTQVYLTKEEYD